MSVINGYDGTCLVQIGERAFTLVYDWRALSSIYSQIGREGLERALDVRATDLPALAVVVAAGMQRHHPECATADAVLDMSPVIFPLVESVTQCVAVAYWGPGGLPEAEEKSTNPLVRPLIRLRSHLRRLFTAA